LFISETNNWKLYLNRDSTLETKTHKENGAHTATHFSEVKKLLYTWRHCYSDRDYRHYSSYN